MRSRFFAAGFLTAAVVAELDGQTERFGTQGVDSGVDTLSDGFAIGDLDGDGIDDLCLATYGGVKILAMLGDAAGGLRLPSVAPGASFGLAPQPLAITDIDNDGKNDLLITGGLIFYLRGDGAGALSSPTLLATGAGGIVNARLFADVNGDGRGDIVTGGVTASNAVAVQLAVPGGFAAPFTISLPGQIVSLAIGDFNGDGNADLVTVDKLYEQKMRVALGDGTGHFAATTAINLPSDPGRVGMGDFDGDGRADIAVPIPASSQIRIFFGTASGAIGPSTVLSTSFELAGATVADVTGDGAVDVVAGHSGTGLAQPIEVFPGDGHGGFGAPVPSYAGSNPSFVVPARFGSDALPDLFVPDSHGLVLGRGGGAFGGVLFADGSLPLVSQQFAFDWNGDGRNDLLQFATNLSQSAGGYVMRFGTATGGLAPQSTTNLSMAPTGDASSADIDHDGRLDVVVAQKGASSFALLRAQANGSFQTTTQSLSIPVLVDGIALADVTGEGDPDLIEAGSGKMVSAAGDGAGQFAVAVALTIPAGGGIAEGDLDLDGDLDLVVATGGYVVLQNQGAGSFVAKTLTLWQGGARALTTDWNQDGFPDLLGYGGPGSYQGRLALELGNGTLKFLETSTLTCLANADHATAIDLDGDGGIEIVLGTNDGAEVVDDDGLGNLRMRRRIIGPPGGHPVAADLDGDARLDLVIAAQKGAYVLREIGPPPCAGSLLAYGTGCAGSGGIVPQTVLEGCPVPGGSLTLRIESALGGSTAFVLLGGGQAGIHIGACTLLVSPILPAILALPLAGVGPGNGTVELNGRLDASTTAMSFALQAVVLDPGVPLGAAFTSAWWVTIP